MTQTLILFILIFGFKVIHIDIGMILLSILIAVSYKKVDFKLQSSLLQLEPLANSTQANS